MAAAVRVHSESRYPRPAHAVGVKRTHCMRPYARRCAREQPETPHNLTLTNSAKEPQRKNIND